MIPEMVLISEYCNNCNVDNEFIFTLEEEGLIEIIVVNEEKYIHASQLSNLERFSHLFYDLSVNIEGIDIIHNLLEKVQKLETELSVLRRYHENNKEYFIEQ